MVSIPSINPSKTHSLNSQNSLSALFSFLHLTLLSCFYHSSALLTPLANSLLPHSFSFPLSGCSLTLSALQVSILLLFYGVPNSLCMLLLHAADRLCSFCCFVLWKYYCHHSLKKNKKRSTIPMNLGYIAGDVADGQHRRRCIRKYPLFLDRAVQCCAVLCCVVLCCAVCAVL